MLEFLCVTISSHRFIYLFLKTLPLPWLSQELGIFSPSARLHTILNIYLPCAKPKKYLSIFSNLACWHFIQNSLSFQWFLLHCTTGLLDGDEQPADGSLPLALPSQGPFIPLCHLPLAGSCHPGLPPSHDQQLCCLKKGPSGRVGGTQQPGFAPQPRWLWLDCMCWDRVGRNTTKAISKRGV